MSKLTKATRNGILGSNGASSTSGTVPKPCQSSYCLYRKLNEDLEVECTNLETSEETTLRQYIQHKIVSSTLQDNSLGMLNRLSVFCFHKLLEVGETLGTTDNTKTIKFAQQYVVCLLCDNETTFALFRNELEMFCTQLSKLLYEVKIIKKRAEEFVKDYLSSWYTYTVEYIARCIDCINEKLPEVLYAALLCKRIVIQKHGNGSGQATFIDDITRFVHSASLQTAAGLPLNRNVSLLVVDGDHTPQGDAITMMLDAQYSLKINSHGAETNSFCAEWASVMNKGPHDPLHLRSMLEQFKTKVVQEFNEQKQLTDQARLNNYALYKSYKLLKHNKNSDVLLALLKCTEDVQAGEVLDVLQSYLQNKA